VKRKAFPLPLTPSERMVLEGVDQGHEPTNAVLERLRKQGWSGPRRPPELRGCGSRRRAAKR
jgi:hypothetical protein